MCDDVALLAFCDKFLRIDKDARPHHVAQEDTAHASVTRMSGKLATMGVSEDFINETGWDDGLESWRV